MNNKNLTQLSVLTVSLLSGASSALAFDQIENQTERGSYPMRDGRVSAEFKIEEISASITTTLDEPDEYNEHVVILAGSCHPNLPFFRENRVFTNGDTLEYVCPQEPDSEINWCTIQYASALLSDGEETPVTPEESEPSETEESGEAPQGEELP